MLNSKRINGGQAEPNISVDGPRGYIAQRNLLASHIAATGSILGVPKNFSLDAAEIK